tara:strand:+ start:73 stop:801 length:729 start_codon:yes stop_codon:yes gene_type:complete
MNTDYNGDRWEYINPFPYIYKRRFDFEFDTFKDKVDSHLIESKRVITENRLTTPEKDGGITSVVLSNNLHNVFPHTWPEFGLFDKFLGDCLETIMDWRGYNQSPPKFVERSWINVHYKNGYTEEHMHHGIDIACVCYLKVPDNSGGLQIKNPLLMYDTSESEVNNYYNNISENELFINQITTKINHERKPKPKGCDWATIDVKTNDVLFFPGWLLHRTQPNLVDEGRYVMSLNIRHVDGFVS